MKTLLKVLAALAAVAGAVYVVAVYGDRIVAWAQDLLDSLPCRRCNLVDMDPTAEEEAPEEAPAEQAAPAEEAAPEAAPAAENEPVAQDDDFEG